MQIEDLYTLLSAHPQIKAVAKSLQHTTENHVWLSGLHGSARSVIINAVHGVSDKRLMVVIMDNQDDAQYCYADLQALGAEVMYFPTSRRRRQGTDDAMLIQRTEVLSSLIANPSSIIVTYPEALAEEVPARESLTQATIPVQSGQTISQTALCDSLAELGFERVDFVYEPGQYAVRGGIVDVYSYAHDDPFRLDFFGNEIDSIRTFDIENQLSKERVSQAILTQEPSASGQEMTTLAEYLPKDTIWVMADGLWVMAERLGLRGFDFQTTIELGPKCFFDNHSQIAFDTLPQPVFNKKFDLLADDLRSKINDGYKIYILADQKKQTDRLAAIFENDDLHFTPVDKTLHAGFIDREAKLCCYTDHEIFERYHRVTLRSENARRGKAVLTLKEIYQLRLGDYVVHSDHGIGQFGGLVTTSVNGKPQEMIKLIYRDGDTIFVSIHNLHRIAKYKGREGSAPTISKIGSGAWERLKERTKDKVKDIARDLIKLYATRKGQKGFAYTPDGYMQHELEASFLYEDTPDQAKATVDVKRDMESPMPMDRLICGDVGFGKTEIAMRAAFKAATDGKQVAVLVPTTVLALQHYNTFRERFKDFPVKI